MQGKLRGLVLAALVTGLMSVAPVAHADSAAREAGIGLGSFFGSLLYAPVKIIYATGGLVVGGLAFVLSGGDGDVTGPIINASVRGDYMLTPDHIRGEKQVAFIGRSPENQAARAQTQAQTQQEGWEPPPDF
jgi:hypothetical protein